MIGAIAGDIIGSRFEHRNHRSLDFELFTEESHFTDDTILTVAVADILLRAENGEDAARRLKEWARRYPTADYGRMFREWVRSDSLTPYNSYGNGSAMRTAPVGWVSGRDIVFPFDQAIHVGYMAEEIADLTHDHEEGRRGACVVTEAIYLARCGISKNLLVTNRQYLRDMEESIDSIRQWYEFDETCQGTVPVAIRAFLESEDWEHAIRLAVSVGGDTDTICAITGAIAEAYYGGVPEAIYDETIARLDHDLLDVVVRFRAKYCRESRRLPNATAYAPGLT